MLWRTRLLVLSFTSLALVAVRAQPPALGWLSQTSGVTGRLRGVSAVSSRTAWASGANGTVLRTTDGGLTWQARPVPAKR